MIDVFVPGFGEVCVAGTGVEVRRNGEGGGHREADRAAPSSGSTQAEVRDGFQVKGLRKQVQQMQLGETIA